MTRFKILLAVAVLCGLVGLPSAGAAEIFIDDTSFEDYTAETDINGQGPWTATAGYFKVQAGARTSPYSNGSDRDRSLRVKRTIAGTARATSDLGGTYTDAAQVFRCAVYFSDYTSGDTENASGKIQIYSAGNSGATRGWNLMFGDGTDGRVSYKDATANRSLDLDGDGTFEGGVGGDDTLAAGMWYELRITLSLVTDDATREDTFRLDWRELGDYDTVAAGADFDEVTNPWIEARDHPARGSVRDLPTAYDVDDTTDFKFTTDGSQNNSVILDTVPEPATVGLLLLGLPFVLRRRR